MMGGTMRGAGAPRTAGRSDTVDDDARRRLPSVGLVLEHELLQEPLRARGRLAVRRAVGAALEELRRTLQDGAEVAADPASVARRSRAILEAERTALRPVINATGVLLHTGLGRAPLAPEAAAAVAEIAA